MCKYNNKKSQLKQAGWLAVSEHKKIEIMIKDHLQ